MLDFRQGLLDWVMEVEGGDFQRYIVNEEVKKTMSWHYNDDGCDRERIGHTVSTSWLEDNEARFT